MPNLFPTETVNPLPEITGSGAGQARFGRSWRFDFDNGDFVLTPAGRVAQCGDEEAWLEWCRKALMTARYRYLVYSRNYGQEFDDLISRHLTRAGNESEIKRITTECLKVDPRTGSVDNFTFAWEGDTCAFTCEVTSTRGGSGTMNGMVVSG